MSLYQRRKTRTVFVGNIAVGGKNPIRIQSMTTSDTKDTEATVAEIIKLVNAGCEIVRLAVPTQADCANLKNIRKALRQKNINVPLVADIHFTPSVAMAVVDYVEKVRINPGNFVDKKFFRVREYTDAQYREELDRIEERLTPLIAKCKERGVAMRIGTNHGSLSDRIMNRFGDTPQGMVESALEFLRIAAKNNYHDIILSMKASNTRLMVTAYRLLARKLAEEGFEPYPFHLGVTEAGDCEDGRIKSAIGIGTLLNEGLGDTIRVSLTEDSIHEIPVAGMLAAPYNLKFFIAQNTPPPHAEAGVKPCGGHASLRAHGNEDRRATTEHRLGPLCFGGKETVRVWTYLSRQEALTDFLKAQNGDIKYEGVEIPATIYDGLFADELTAQNFALAVSSYSAEELIPAGKAHKRVFFIRDPSNVDRLKPLITDCRSQGKHLEYCFEDFPVYEPAFRKALKRLKSLSFENDFTDFSFSIKGEDLPTTYRLLAYELKSLDLPKPIHLRYKQNNLPLLIDASVALGSLLIDGIGDSIQIDSHAGFKERLHLSYGILQASRVRLSKTEFIACPSCGRTLFDLQEVTAKIRARTSHLKGLKIGIMGCIVNGPGEMADADFGYVGTGTGKISLYVGRECVKRNIPEANALEELIALIKKHKRWVEPAVPAKAETQALKRHGN